MRKSWMNHKGQLLVELLMAIGLAAIILPGIAGGIMASREGKVQQQKRFAAVSRLQEAHEAVRSVRESGWDNLPTSGTYYPTLSADGLEWELAPGSSTVDGYTTSITFGEINRLNGMIVPTPTGVLDRSTRKALITVSWATPLPSSIDSTIYLTRYLENDSFTETTQNDFNFLEVDGTAKAYPGLKTGVTVRATTPPGVSGDGEIVLGSGGYGNWCEPTLTSISYDVSGNGVAKDISAVEGSAFLVTGENAAGPDFINLSINNPAQPTPPSVTSQGSYDQNYKSNTVFAETVGSTKYAYIGSDDNGTEVAILNATNNPPTRIGTINASGNADVRAVYVSNNILYIAGGSKLSTYDVSNKASPVYRGEVSLSSTVTDLIVVDGYAYASIATSNGRDMEIVQVSNGGASLSVVGYTDVSAESAQAIFVNSSGTRAYIGANSSSSRAEFFIINTESKSGSRPIISSFDSNNMSIKGLAVVPGNRAIIVGHGGYEYQVINLDTETAPTLCGFEDTPDNINGLATILESDGDAYSYLITTNADKEFSILVGGPGGTYATIGEFESATFASAYPTANNRISATFLEPSGNTNIRFQVSLVNQVSGTCPSTGSYTFVGPDGTTSTYFDQASGASIAFPLSGSGSYSNPGQCFRYKAYLSSTDSSQTPVLNDVTINYSP